MNSLEPYSIDATGTIDFNPHQENYNELNQLELINNITPNNFNDNLAQYLNESELKIIANDLLEGVKEDKESRVKWEDGYKTGLKYLGIEQNFEGQNQGLNFKVYDSTLLDAVLRFVATAGFELYPSKGVASYEAVTPDGSTNEMIERYGEQRKNALNDYLKYGDKVFYQNSQSMLMPLALNGCAFKKIYFDPVTQKPISRFIKPQHLIVNNDCNSLLDSERITHVLYLTKKEIAIRENTGFFIQTGKLSSEKEKDFEFNDEVEKQERITDGITDEDDVNEKFIFKHYESHVSLDYNFLLDLEPVKPNFPLPYIVTVCRQTRKVVAIYRNWVEGDETFSRENHFVQFNYFSGFGLYGYGMLHFLGNNAIALTILERQMLTAGGMANYPAYFIQKGLRIEHPNVELQPGQGIPIESGGMSIRDVVSPIPFKGADPVLKDLANDLKARTERTGSIADTKLAEVSPNAPVGTTIALLETQQKVQSAVIRSLYNSLTEELQMLDKKLTPPSQTPEEQQLNGLIRIIPACDPTFSTNVQRIMKADAMFKIAASAPQLHNMREIYNRYYLSIGIENIEQILPPEQNPIPLDPITENMNILNNKAIKADIWQDHASHITCHQVFAEQNKNQDFLPNVLAHIREHLAFAYLIQMQQAMGIQLPPTEALRNPKVQNEVAMMAAQAAESQGLVMDSEKAPEITEVAMAEVEQKREATHMKAATDMQKVELEAYKATLSKEVELKKLEAQKEMADERNKTEIEANKIRTQSRSD